MLIVITALGIALALSLFLMSYLVKKRFQLEVKTVFLKMEIENLKEKLQNNTFIDFGDHLVNPKYIVAIGKTPNEKEELELHVSSSDDWGFDGQKNATDLYKLVKNCDYNGLKDKFNIKVIGNK